MSPQQIGTEGDQHLHSFIAMEKVRCSDRWRGGGLFEGNVP